MADVVLTPEQIETVVQNLRGSCGSIDVEIENLELGVTGVATESLLAIDDQVFECQRCGWWCDTDELSDNEHENVCDDCENDG